MTGAEHDSGMRVAAYTFSLSLELSWVYGERPVKSGCIIQTAGDIMTMGFPPIFPSYIMRLNNITRDLK